MGVSAQVNGAGAPQNGAADCAALCPNAKDIMCAIRNKCWKSLVSMSAGVIGLLAAGASPPCSNAQTDRSFMHALHMSAAVTPVQVPSHRGLHTVVACKKLSST